ncbi:hypothetical protein AB0M02_06775 [Actinoplanes sp. NPDC051861]|uniref:hypothetical protein n=1 Tax=Actinoplanes sp. NPDC051861 TaxID=3155170 RepID=UPI00343F1A19
MADVEFRLGSEGEPGSHGGADGMPVAGRPVPAFVDEATDRLPIIKPAITRRPPPPRVAGRVVLIYEHQIRKPWRLLVFTAALVSLTIGVVLGQTEAYQPPSRPAAAAQISAPVPSPVVQPPAPLTAPLGAVKERRLELSGAATTLRVRTADLGESLFTAAAPDQGAGLQLTDTAQGSVLTLTPGPSGTVGAEVVLNTRVAWTLKLTGGAIDLDVDSRAGGLVGMELAAGVSRAVLQLSEPKGTVPLTITGAVSDLTVRTATGAPARVRLGRGAGLATLDGKPRRDVKAGATLRESGWSTAKNRYDVRVTADVSTILVDRVQSAG